MWNVDKFLIGTPGLEKRFFQLRTCAGKVDDEVFVRSIKTVFRLPGRSIQVPLNFGKFVIVEQCSVVKEVLFFAPQAVTRKFAIIQC